MLSGLFHGQLRYDNDIIIGCTAQTELCIPKLKGKHVGPIASQISVIGKTPLLDNLNTQENNIVMVFGLQRGF